MNETWEDPEIDPNAAILQLQSAVDGLRNKKGRFAPPSVQEVSEYAKEIGYQLDSNSFVDFYTQKGWMVGKNKMKDWKAAVRTWKARNAADNPEPKTFERKCSICGDDGVASNGRQWWCSKPECKLAIRGY